MVFDSRPSGRANHEYAMWDAAYVLGSLPRADRLEFEAHMQDCASCRRGVAELSGMPALLSQLDRDEVAAIADHAGACAAPLLPTEALPSLLTKVGSLRRRRWRYL
jgi:anti-sigma factor RsiW